MKARILNMSLAACLHLPAAAALQEEIDWPEFIGRHDLVWEETPCQWNEGAFTGNGQLGMMVHATLDDNRIDFHLGRNDVTDHRLAPDRKTSLGTPGASHMIDYPRLDIGIMALRPAGKIQSMTLHQDLWNAELRGTVTTDLGVIQLRALTPRDRMVQLIEIESTEKAADGTDASWKWEFLPGNPTSPHVQIFPQNPEAKTYEPNPLPVLEHIEGVKVCVQKLLAGGDYATAWLQRDESPRKAALFIATANEVPAAGKSAVVAARDAREAAEAPRDQIIAAHRSWWHDFYQKSFLTIPDPRLESFYWIQLYKLASAIRKDGPPLDLSGPWFRVNEWPGIWWNLNIQLTYWPLPPANHMQLSATYNKAVDDHFEGLLSHFGGHHNMGDLAWALHNYWLHLRHEADWQGMRDGWLPKAVRVFPAVPAAWKQAAFRDLRAQGAFLVSAAREDGKTAWISIESLAGEPLVLKVPDWSGPLEVVSGPKQELKESAPGEYTIALKKGERITLRPAGSQAEVVVRPLARPADKNHPYGLKKGGSLPPNMSFPFPPLRLEQ